MPELSRLWPLKTGTPLLNTLLGSGCEMGVPKLSCCTCCWYCASCCCWKWSCEWSCECIRGYACCCSNEGASISEQNFCYCSMPESSPILPQRSKANHRPLSPHRKSTPKKRKKRKWAAKTKVQNNISDAAAAKSAIEQKSTALFSSSSSLCFTRAVVAGLRRVAHTVGYCRAPSSILPKRRKAASKNLLHRRSVFTVSNSTEPHSLLIRRSSSHPTIACTTVTYAVGLN